MDWFRKYHGAITDPKHKLIAKLSGQRLNDVRCVWEFLMEQASEAQDRGSIAHCDALFVAVALDMEEHEVEAIMAAQRKRGMITADERLAAWERRNPSSDSSGAERQRRYRERQRQLREVPETEEGGGESGNGASDGGGDEPGDNGGDSAGDATRDDHRDGRDVTAVTAVTPVTTEIREDKNRPEKTLSANADLSAPGGADPPANGTLPILAMKPHSNRPRDLHGDPPVDPLAQAFEIWLEVLGEVLPRPHELSGGRRRKLKRRLEDSFGRDLGRWREYCDRIRGSPHLTGQNGDWRATFDWCLEPRNLQKIIEGNYDPAPSGGIRSQRRSGPASIAAAGVRAAARFGD